MSNLLKETLSELKDNGKKEKDVKWVGNLKQKTTWDNFKKIANIDYDSGYGGQEVATDLLIVGDNWWMERHEYDGSEWWEFKQLPKEPSETVELKTVVGGSWSDLSGLNNESSED